MDHTALLFALQVSSVLTFANNLDQDQAQQIIAPDNGSKLFDPEKNI